MQDLNMQEALTAANIRAMRQALDDISVDQHEHAYQHAVSVGPTEKGVVALMLFDPNIPAMVPTEESPVATLPEHDHTTPRRVNPKAMVLTIRNNATATISYNDAETRKKTLQELTQEQQATADEYASKVGLHLQAIANCVELSPDERLELEEDATSEDGSVEEKARLLAHLLRRAERMSAAMRAEAALICELMPGAEASEVLHIYEQITENLIQAREQHDNMEWIPG